MKTLNRSECSEVSGAVTFNQYADHAIVTVGAGEQFNYVTDAASFLLTTSGISCTSAPFAPLMVPACSNGGITFGGNSNNLGALTVMAICDSSETSFRIYYL